MAKLSYAAIIERDQRARALAELGLRLARRGRFARSCGGSGLVRCGLSKG